MPTGKLVADKEVDMPAKKKPMGRPPKPKIITFYWRNNANITFSVGGMKGKVYSSKGSTLDEPGQFYKTVNSVIRLNTSEDKLAIEYLRAKKGNEANGGNQFSEMDIRSEEPSEAGTTIDKLMSYDVKTLASMVGGTVADYRKSKGTLIAELMEK